LDLATEVALFVITYIQKSCSIVCNCEKRSREATHCKSLHVNEAYFERFIYIRGRNKFSRYEITYTISLGNQIKKLRRKEKAKGRIKVHRGLQLENLKERDYLKDLGEDRGIILKFTFLNEVGRTWTRIAGKFLKTL
jgi:hypothetical protein